MSEGNGNGYSKEALPKSLPLPETSVKMAMLASPEGNITPCLSQPQPSFVEDSIPGNPPETSSPDFLDRLYFFMAPIEVWNKDYDIFLHEKVSKMFQILHFNLFF